MFVIYIFVVFEMYFRIVVYLNLVLRKDLLKTLSHLSPSLWGCHLTLASENIEWIGTMIEEINSSHYV